MSAVIPGEIIPGEGPVTINEGRPVLMANNAVNLNDVSTIENINDNPQAFIGAEVTLTGNVAGKAGGAIDNHLGGAVTVSDSTVSGNYAPESGSALSATAGSEESSGAYSSANICHATRKRAARTGDVQRVVQEILDELGGAPDVVVLPVGGGVVSVLEPIPARGLQQ